MFIDILEEVFKACDSKQTESVFASARFTRRMLKKSHADGSLLVIRDQFGESGYSLFYFSFFFNDDADKKVQFVLSGEKLQQECMSDKTWISVQKTKKAFLIPTLPVTRQWDDAGKIICESANHYVRYDDRFIIFEVQPVSSGSFEIIVLEAPNQWIPDLYTLYENGFKKYALTGPWVTISPLLDCWKFMVDSKIYEYREGISREASARFRSQQAALFLYKLLAVQEEHARELVKIIKDEIAYCVLLDIEDDGRWVHGCWTDEMETHVRFQTDGIHLLIDHYEETGEPVFLEKALLAAGYLLSLTDTLRGGALWFLHDTLELGNRYIHPVIKSRAFGKSESNILCLNTHLSALCALARLYEQTKRDDLKTAVDSGLKAARMVLESERGRSLHGILFYLVDLSFDKPHKWSKRKFPGMKGALKIALGYGARRLLPYAKKAFPRILMPNGFTTRHLSLPHESFHYHIVNVYDMLVLYQLLTLNGCEGLEWLWNCIDRAVKYCFRGNLIKYMVKKRDKFIPHFIEVLVMYGALNKEFDRGKLVDAALSLKDAGCRFTSGSYGFDNLITPKEYRVQEVSLGDCGPDIESFNTSPRDKEFKELLVINTGPDREKIDIVLRDKIKRLEVISSDGDGIRASSLILDPRDYLLIRLYEV